MSSYPVRSGILAKLLNQASNNNQQQRHESSSAMGPALQRLIVVGAPFSGKRSFVECLRSSSTISSSSALQRKDISQFGDHSRFHGQKSNVASTGSKSSLTLLPFKDNRVGYHTITPCSRGFGCHYAAIAYHHECVDIEENEDQEIEEDGDEDNVDAENNNNKDFLRKEGKGAKKKTKDGSNNGFSEDIGDLDGEKPKYITPLQWAMSSNNSSSSDGKSITEGNLAAVAGTLPNNNTYIEVFICEKPEMLDIAIPSIIPTNKATSEDSIDEQGNDRISKDAVDDDDLINSTAIVFVIDASDLSRAAAITDTWTKAINNRVRLVLHERASQKILSSTNLHSSSSNNVNTSSSSTSLSPPVKTKTKASNIIGSSFSTNKQPQGDKVKNRTALASIKAKVEEGLQKYLQNRINEWNVEISLLPESLVNKMRGIALESKFFPPQLSGIDNISNNISNVNGTFPVNTIQSEETIVKKMPDSLKCLLPSIIVLNKVDVLDELCKSFLASSASYSPSYTCPTNNANVVTQAHLYHIAVHHGRWLALQRGAAFATAISVESRGVNTNTVSRDHYQHLTGVSLMFDVLWHYFIYELIPQYNVYKHLKFNDNFNNSAGGQQVILADRIKASHGNKNDDNGGGSIAALDSTLSSLTATRSSLAVALTSANGTKDVLKSLNQLIISHQAKIMSSPPFLEAYSLVAVTPISCGSGNVPEGGISGVSNTSIFIPRGFDDFSYLFQDAMSQAFVEIIFNSYQRKTRQQFGGDGYADPESFMISPRFITAGCSPSSVTAAGSMNDGDGPRSSPSDPLSLSGNALKQRTFTKELLRSTYDEFLEQCLQQDEIGGNSATALASINSNNLKDGFGGLTTGSSTNLTVANAAGSFVNESSKKGSTTADCAAVFPNASTNKSCNNNEVETMIWDDL